MPGLLRGIARTAVVAGTATAVAGGVHRRQQRRWAAQDQQTYTPPPQPVYEAPRGTAPAAPLDPLAQLKELGELHAQGVLTDEEFAVEKAKILNS